MVKRYFTTIIPLLLGLWALIFYGNDVLRLLEDDRPSVSRGSATGGNLQNGKRLPSYGDNFRVNSRMTALFYGNAVNDRVLSLILDTYDSLNVILPNKTFIYGETNSSLLFGQKGNGLTVDFMVPVVDLHGNSTTLPTYPWNGFGYGFKFDVIGKKSPYRIDFQAMAAHIFVLNKLAKQHNMTIERVLFDPGLQPILFRTAFGARLQQEIEFSKVRSKRQPFDNHYRIHFSLSAESVDVAIPGAD